MDIESRVSGLELRMSKLDGIVLQAPPVIPEVKPPPPEVKPPPADTSGQTLQQYALTHGVQFASLGDLFDFAKDHSGATHQATIDAWNTNPNWRASTTTQPPPGTVQVGDSGGGGSLYDFGQNFMPPAIFPLLVPAGATSNNAGLINAVFMGRQLGACTLTLTGPGIDSPVVVPGGSGGATIWVGYAGHYNNGPAVTLLTPGQTYQVRVDGPGQHRVEWHLPQP